LRDRTLRLVARERRQASVRERPLRHRLVGCQTYPSLASREAVEAVGAAAEAEAAVAAGGGSLAGAGAEWAEAPGVG
jgi:hypothetical protein